MSSRRRMSLLDAFKPQDGFYRKVFAKFSDNDKTATLHDLLSYVEAEMHSKKYPITDHDYQFQIDVQSWIAAVGAEETIEFRGFAELVKAHPGCLLASKEFHDRMAAEAPPTQKRSKATEEPSKGQKGGRRHSTVGPQKMASLEKLFGEIDADRSGSLSKDEVTDAVNKMLSKGDSPEGMDSLFSVLEAIDSCPTAELAFDDFVDVMADGDTEAMVM